MKKIAIHCSRTTLEILAGLTVIIIIACSAIAWKLSQGPLDIAHAIPYIQNEFHETTGNEKIEIESLTLEWNSFKRPLELNAKNIVISNDRGPYLFAPEIDIDISLRSLLIGQLRFQTIWIRNIALSITKTIDGQMQITGHSAAQVKTPENNDVIPATLTLNDLIYDLPEVDTLWIDNARVIYKDETNDTTQKFDPATFFIEMKETKKSRNLYGFLTFPFGDGTSDNTVKMNFSTQYDPTLLNISGSLSNTPIDSFVQFFPKMPDGLDFNMVVNSEIRAQLDNGWNLHQLDLKLNAPRGQINFPLNGKEDHVDVRDFDLHMIHDPKTDIATVNTLKAKINDAVNIELSGSVSHPQKPKSLSGNVNLSIKNLPQSYFKTYWPHQFSQNGAYEWLTHKMTGGVFSTLNLTTIFDASATTRTDDSPLPPQIISIIGDTSYEGLNVAYSPSLSPAKNIRGTGQYKDIELTLNVESADVGGMLTQGATLYFDDLIRKGAGHATLEFPITSQIQDVFDYISTEPISAFKNSDFKPVNTKGDINATIKLGIPLKKGSPVEKIKVAVAGAIDNVSVPNALNSLTLSGGPYDIFVTSEELKMNGSGQLSGKPITLDWHEYFKAGKPGRDYVSKVDATITANDKIRRAFTRDFADHFKGNTTGKIAYVKNNDGRNTNIDLDLDLTNTHVDVPSIGIDKRSGQKANAKLNIVLKDDNLTKINDLKVTGPTLSLASGEFDFRTADNQPIITKGMLKNISFNENKLSVLMAEEDGLLKTNVTGAFLDARPLIGQNKDEAQEQSRDDAGRIREYGIDVLEMRAADDATIKNATAYIKLDKEAKPTKFELDGKLGDNGQSGDLYIRYTPDVPGGLSLRVESNNAGETLRAFDLYSYIRGGQLQIAGTPLEGGRFGDVRGKARINDFSVSKAPVLLRLINALSFQNFLQAGSLKFTRLESDFEWKLGDNGDVYNISNGTSSGTSVALTFDGFVDTSTDNINIKGTAAPLSEINNFIGKIPLIGQILTGGDALLAATYSIKGDPSDPSVTVNPLSVLAPGIIRKMLFENTPKSEDQKEKPPLKERGKLN